MSYVNHDAHILVFYSGPMDGMQRFQNEEPARTIAVPYLDDPLVVAMPPAEPRKASYATYIRACKCDVWRNGRKLHLYVWEVAVG